jgi:hypothetical protein
LTDPDLKAGYARQLWFYKYLVYKNLASASGLKIGRDVYHLAHTRVQSVFYSFRKPKEDFENKLEITDGADPMQFIRESEVLLAEMIGQLLDPELPFRQTSDKQVCEYCDFRGICNR